MCNLFSCVTVFYFAIVLCHGISIHKSGIQVRNRREISDECRPFPPPHRHHGHGHHGPDDGHKKMPPMCCELPEILAVEEGSFDKCHELLRKPGSPDIHGAHKHGGKKNTKRSSEENQGDSTKDGSGTPPPPPPPGFMQEKKECMLNCVFNMSGLLTGDGLLNEDKLNQNRLLQMAANNTKWATTIDPVYKKCIAAAKEANSQSQKPCKPGASEYMKCMSRELFFNCPSDQWVNSAECNEFKNKLEKCPNLWAPYPPLWAPHPHPPGQRHENHHRRVHQIHY